MTIVLALGQQAQDSRVLLDGFDITKAVVGVEVRAFVGERSIVTLTLSGRVELIGDVDVAMRQAKHHG